VMLRLRTFDLLAMLPVTAALKIFQEVCVQPNYLSVP
jgi:hypothetical protein